MPDRGMIPTARPSAICLRTLWISLAGSRGRGRRFVASGGESAGNTSRFRKGSRLLDGAGHEPPARQRGSAEASPRWEVIERNGAILAKGRGRARHFGLNLVAFGGGLTKFRDGLTKTGRSRAPLGESIEDIGELDIAPLPPEELPEQLPEPERVRTLPPARPGKGEPPKAAPRAVAKRSKGSTRKADKAAQQNQKRRVTPQPTPTPTPETDPELPVDVQEAIARLGKRPRSERLREVIEAICRSRPWTTVAELSDFLGVSEKTLRSRHVPEMVKQGRLVRRFPNRRRHRGQAYVVPSSSSLGPESRY